MEKKNLKQEKWGHLEADEDDDHHDVVVPGGLQVDQADLAHRVEGKVHPAQQVSPRVQRLVRPPEQTVRSRDHAPKQTENQFSLHFVNGQ